MGRKVPRYSIVEMTNTDPEFYGLLGPFLSRREVVDELGSPVWDDDDKLWFVALSDEDAEVIGFASVKPGTACAIQSLYVLPEHRGDVIGAALVLRMLARWPSAAFKATATPASVALFEECGFTESGTRGRYTTFALEPT